MGHDNNRDFYMANMSESANANRMMYREWYPVIMYNHHQTGPGGRRHAGATVPQCIRSSWIR